MADDERKRRSYGTGSLIVRKDANGVETYYGKWRANGRQVMRKVGPKRVDSTPDGLTKKQAEEALRNLIRDTTVPDRPGERIDIEEAARRYLIHAARQGRKLSTRQNIESEVRVHLAPFFEGRTLDAIQPSDVADLIRVLEAKVSPKTVRNIVATLSALFTHGKAASRGWVTSNPCEGAELPAVRERDEIRFLTLDEVDALVLNARKGEFEAIDRALYRTAAMTGLRKGELLALRWKDVDWQASRVRVRQNYVRGEFGTPKSRRSTRSVPLAAAVGGELDRLFQASRWQADDDLVFAHPATGGPLTKANVTRRMRASLRAAGLDDSHVFHDLRHTFGTMMAAAGVPMRTLQEWMGHRDITTTQIYADYAPNAREAEMVEAAFARATNPSTNLSEPHTHERA